MLINIEYIFNDLKLSCFTVYKYCHLFANDQSNCNLFSQNTVQTRDTLCPVGRSSKAECQSVYLCSLSFSPTPALSVALLCSVNTPHYTAAVNEVLNAPIKLSCV